MPAPMVGNNSFFLQLLLKNMRRVRLFIRMVNQTLLDRGVDLQDDCNRN
jgi:hypothetical protein